MMVRLVIIILSICAVPFVGAVLFALFLLVRVTVTAANKMQ